MKMTVHHLTARLIDGGLTETIAANIAQGTFGNLNGTFGEPMLKRLFERVTDAKRTAVFAADQAQHDQEFAATLSRVTYEIQDEMLAEEGVA
jgi:hypothetical protein